MAIGHIARTQLGTQISENRNQTVRFGAPADHPLLGARRHRRPPLAGLRSRLSSVDSVARAQRVPARVGARSRSMRLPRAPRTPPRCHVLRASLGPERVRVRWRLPDASRWATTATRRVSACACNRFLIHISCAAGQLRGRLAARSRVSGGRVCTYGITTVMEEAAASD